MHFIVWNINRNLESSACLNSYAYLFTYGQYAPVKMYAKSKNSAAYARIYRCIYAHCQHQLVWIQLLTVVSVNLVKASLFWPGKYKISTLQLPQLNNVTILPSKNTSHNTWPEMLLSAIHSSVMGVCITTTSTKPCCVLIHADVFDVDGLAQECSNCSALVMELPKSCDKPLKYHSTDTTHHNSQDQDCACGITPIYIYIFVFISTFTDEHTCTTTHIITIKL